MPTVARSNACRAALDPFHHTYDTNCACGRTTCRTCLARLAASLPMPLCPAITAPDRQAVVARRLGLSVEDRVARTSPHASHAPNELGALVREVATTGIGAELGIRAGDLLVAIGATPVASAAEIRLALAALGDAPLRVTLRRGAVRMDVTLED